MMFSLYPYLILAGTTILLVMAWLLRQARRQTRLNLDLLRLNESLHFDLPDFLRRCWPQLSQAGFSGLSWQLDWFGTWVTGTEGTTKEDALHRRLDVQEISLEVSLHHDKRRWEQRYFSESLAEIFFLLLHVDMWIKMGAVQGAFSQAAKLGLFLQHDMKNIAQFIRLAADQLAGTAPEHEPALLNTLKAAMPSVRDRADRILGTLSGSGLVGEIRPVSLAEAWQQAANMRGLEMEIHGAATAAVALETLHSIIDNLLGNYADLAHQTPENPPLIRIALSEKDGQALSIIQDVHGRPCTRPERLFEPFWSEQGKGIGIGLYQARQLAVSASGSLEIQAPSDQPLSFVLKLPGAKPKHH
jgi:signal transduction histidine kinase